MFKCKDLVLKFQRDSYSCGVAATINAIRCYGRKIPERQIRAHSATKEEYGTSEHGIKNSLLRVGYNSKDLNTTNKQEFLSSIISSLTEGNPIILLVDKRQHWVVCMGMLGSNKYLVFDSTRTKKNKEEHGVHVYRGTQLASRIKNTDGTYYGILVSKI